MGREEAGSVRKTPRDDTPLVRTGSFCSCLRGTNTFIMKKCRERKDSQSKHIPLSWWQTPLVKTGESGTRATEGQGAELQDSRLPLVLLLWLPSLMSQ